jgi:hypothetical protein
MMSKNKDKNKNKDKGWHQVKNKKDTQCHKFNKIENFSEKDKKYRKKEKEDINIKNEILFKKIILNDDIESDDNENLKKILCHNIIYNGECKYGDKCLYAHNLNDQNINTRRKIAYDIIKSEDDLSNINLKLNNDLYRTLLELTRYCKNCNNNLCIGGYNCKSGAYDIKYCVCINDLNYGDCNNPKCNLLHLTKRGLIPYYQYNDIRNMKKNNFSRNSSFSSNSSFSCENGNDIIDIISSQSDSMSDSENHIVFHENNLKKNNYEKYIELLCNRSIFMK